MLHNLSASSLESEGFNNEELDPVINKDNDAIYHGEDITPTQNSPLQAAIAESGLFILCTEIPPPCMLKDNGYIDVMSTHVPRHVVMQPHSNNKSPNHLQCRQSPYLEGSLSPPVSLSSGNTPVTNPQGKNSSSMGSARSNPFSSLTSCHAVVSNHSFERPLLTFCSGRDLTLQSPLSPLEPQPMTMPDMEVMYIYTTQ